MKAGKAKIRISIRVRRKEGSWWDHLVDAANPIYFSCITDEEKAKEFFKKWQIELATIDEVIS